MIRASNTARSRLARRHLRGRRRPRPILGAGVWAASLLITAAPAWGAPRTASRIPTWPADSLRPGMTGVAVSVFQGTRLDTFPVTILGVLKGNSPGGDLILGRAHGSYLEHTGIIAGMSGSPVYVGGRLIGALAFAFPFAKEPVAGITPIGEMLRDLTEPAGPGSPGDESRFGELGSPLPDERLAAAAVPGGAEPIATPIALSGFTPAAQRFLEPWLRERGFVASPGGGAEPGGSCDSIVPGSAVGVQLIRGDWSATAIGTVTHREGTRVLALGHPFFSIGRVRLPLTAATIHAVIPTQQVSSKVGGATIPCGTLVADRGTGVAGEIGLDVTMVPVRVAVAGPEGRTQRYRFEVARSRFLTPGLIAATVVNSISGALFDVGAATTRFEIAYHLDGGARTLRRGDALLVGGPVAGIGEEVLQTLGVLLSNRFQPATLDSVHVSLSVEEGLESEALSAIRISPAIVAPGEPVEIEIVLRAARQGVETRRVSIRVPPQTPPGELSVRVCNGPETDRWERDRAPKRYEAQDFDQLVAILGGRRRSDRLYVQLHRPAAGAAVRGGEISQAPASVLEVLGSGPAAGATSPTKGATLEEVELPLGRPVDGCETTTLTVMPYRAR